MANTVEKIHDMIIVGSGPAGLTAAIYASRAKLDAIMIDKGMPGGQVLNTYEVDNYPGIPDTTGPELAMKIQEHAMKYDMASVFDEVIDLDLTDKVKKVVTPSNTYYGKTVVVSTGAQWRELGVKGEQEFKGRGVSYCATCDGAFFRDKVVAVVGGGDVAVEDAIYLARFCKKVYLIHRRDELRAVKVLQHKLFETEGVEIIWDTVLEEIKGDDVVKSINLHNKKTDEDSSIEVDGVFIAVGTIPNSDLLKDKVITDEGGYVVTNEGCETSVPGVFAVGDVRKKLLRQVITAASDGATAVYAAEHHMIENF
ncbi:thioredoxin-disulfide reductase [Vallitalea okinawensis]|uniref:thioredoxin-disulfide reductase n=1 Tax=Vallitalea okinawensis TaxID=2078660 RepID=UPI000CFD5A7D|nr:thioredoxin-disulfide reductase [Vallitalea okinawensis]